MSPWLCLPIGYLIGGIPTGIWLTKLVSGVDPRASGSGSSGATNVSRIAGKKWAALVLVIDTLKGYLPVRLLTPLVAPQQVELAMVFMTVGCVAGHVWTPYAGFRGGKGVATAAGSWIALNLTIFGMAIAAWLLTFSMTRIVSVSSLVAAAALPISTALLIGTTSPVFWLALGIALFIFLTHRDNLRRILQREERRIL